MGREERSQLHDDVVREERSRARVRVCGGIVRLAAFAIGFNSLPRGEAQRQHTPRTREEYTLDTRTIVLTRTPIRSRC